MFSWRLNNYNKYWKIINSFSLISVFIVYLPTIITDIFGLIYIPWTNQVNITMI